METDTGHNESGHKGTKTATKLTQHNEETFDLQVVICLEEVELIELAMAEINGEFGAYHEEKKRESVPFIPKKIVIGLEELCIQSVWTMKATNIN